MNKYTLTAMLVVGIFGFQGVLKAADEAAPVAAKVKVGNKICPVSGEKIEVGTGMEAMTVEHNGKIYNLCCGMCVKDFQSDPDKYSKIADDEVAQAVTK